MRNLLGFLFLALAAIAQPACAEGEKILHRGNGAEPETLDPHLSVGVSEYSIQLDIFEGLVSYSAKGEIVPGAAQSWEISQDGKTYIFNLRENGKWSNGQKVVAEDFVYSLARALDPKTAAEYAPILDVIVGAEAFRKGTDKNFASVGVKALSPLKLEVKLNNSTPYFLGMLRHNIAMPVHKPTVEKFGDKWTRPGNLVGNGAFALKTWTPNNSIVLSKNPHYWDNGKTKVDQVIYYPHEYTTEELKKFRAGELHATYDVPADQMQWLEENMKDELRNTPYVGVYYFAVNLTKEPFGKSKELRRALSLAIDREIMVEKVTKSDELPAYSYVPQMDGYQIQEADFKSWPQDKKNEEAKKLLAAAGYGPDKPLVAEILYNTSENNKKIAIAAAVMWKKALGVETILVNQEWKVYLESRFQKNYQLARTSWVADYLDPINFLDQFTSDAGDRNILGYNNPAYDNLIKESHTIADQAKRMKVLEQAERLLVDDVVLIPIYHYTTQHMVSKKVTGWEDNVLDLHLSRFMDLK